MPKLIPHPEGSDTAAGLVLEAELVERSGPILKASYVLEGPLAELLIPAPAAGAFTLGLWEHTCFELFVAETDAVGYHEFNFSPSGDWAVLGFTDYREGSPIKDPATAPELALDRSDDRLHMDVTVDLGSLAARYARAELAVGFSAVLESTTGQLSYWALHHPGPSPDFHHRDGFRLRVEARSPA